MKHWIARNGDAHTPLPVFGVTETDGAYARAADRLHIPPAVVRLLEHRGLKDIHIVNEFLSPNLRHLASPDKWPGLEQAAQTLLAAIRNGREVLVWGDYDVDGVTAASLCYEVLHHHNIPVSVHLPERRSEGYGLNAASLQSLAADGKRRVLVTVDCGINDNAAVEMAKSLGMTVIITDHHVPPENLPPADAVYDPHLTPSCPCPNLAGVGVAFFLMARMNQLLAPLSRIPVKDMREVLDLVCLGTLADMVSLTGQNRILTKNGLLKIAEAARPGLSDLKFVSGYERAERLDAGQVVFSLAPRINAAGRVGTPIDAFKLLSGTYGTESMQLAKKLDELNVIRRAKEDKIAKSAIEQAEQMLAAKPDLAALVVYGADWHPGVIGIVASRLVEKYNRPSLVLCAIDENGTLKGSGRSVPGFDLHGSLTACADLLLGYGGHRQAAGISMAADNLDALRARFHQITAAKAGEIGTPFLEVDGILPFTLASNTVFLKTLDLLQPFGVDNPEPIFTSRPLTVKGVKFFGPSREHASIRLQEAESGITLQAKYWRLASELPPLPEGTHMRLAFTVGLNAYNGIPSVELIAKDWEILPKEKNNA